ncbi:integrase [Macrococcoides goetzii]|uniref:Integrase n=1 Tax=Macrococcoides goetzii TaxID=1891097 RepID=A0A2G5NUM8_9STAP|nr:site-specific integrase [Macrococcus goetzii]RAI79708.1 integrase [Macrococcus goetzii]
MKIKKLDNGKWAYDFRYNGKRYRSNSCTSKREATQKANELYDKVSKGYRPNNHITLHEYYNTYHETYTQEKVSAKTYSNYERLGKLLETEFGHKNMKDITRSEYQSFINDLAKKHVLDGVSRYNNYIKKVVLEAIDEGIIHRDFTHNVNIFSKIESKEEHHKYYDMEELKAVKRYYLDRTQYYKPSTYLILLMIATGGRFSDCINLKREHINEVAGTIYLDGTKNKGAKRTVEVDRDTIKLLLDYIDHVPTHISGYIFTHAGKRISNKSVNESIAKCNKALEIKKDTTSHAFRHSHVSFLLYKGVSIYYISKRLGHASIDITIQEYSHLIKEAYKEEAESTIKHIQSL